VNGFEAARVWVHHLTVISEFHTHTLCRSPPQLASEANKNKHLILTLGIVPHGSKWYRPRLHRACRLPILGASRQSIRLIGQLGSFGSAVDRKLQVLAC